jgi:hypothetical protein
MSFSGIKKNTVRTSQETKYASPTELSRLVLCKISGFHGDDYEECRGSCNIRRFGGTYRVLRLLVTADVPISPIFVTLMMEAIYSSEMPVLTRATRHNIPGDGILHKFV